MTNLQQFEPSPEQLERFRSAYMKVMCNAAVVSGVQPPMTISGATQAKNALLNDLTELKSAYEDVATNSWAQQAYNQIANRLQPISEYNSETVAKALQEYCIAFWQHGIKNFSAPTPEPKKNPFA